MDKINFDQFQQGKQAFNARYQIKQTFCPEGNKCHFICFQRKCNFSAFSCSQHKCSCQKNHQNCSMKKCQTVVKKLQQKFVFLKPIIDQNDRLITQKIQYFQNIIDQLKYQKKLLYKQWELTIANYFMSEDQKKVLQSMTQKNPAKISGNFMNNVQKQIFKDMKIVLEEQIKKIRKYWQQKQTQPSKIFQKIKAFKKNFTIQQPLHQIQHHSKIIKTDVQFTFLKGLFKGSIKYAKLLYRGSQQEFKLKGFKQKCVNVRNTLTLINTGSKKIGGFTDLQWKNIKDQNYISSQETFLFSVTDKYRLKNYGVKNNQNYGPYFVSTLNNSNSLAIQSQSNKRVEQCKIAYPSKDNSFLCGDRRFMIGEWQVWYINLQK